MANNTARQIAQTQFQRRFQMRVFLLNMMLSSSPGPGREHEGHPALLDSAPNGGRLLKNIIDGRLVV